MKLKSPEYIAKAATPRTLYVSRKVMNGTELVKWAKAQGFTKVVSPDDLHVTIAHSKAKIDWMKVPESWSNKDDGSIEVKPGGPRAVEKLGDKGAVVLMFNNYDLSWRHESIKNLGASWDYDSYQPHVTITYSNGDGIDLEKITPYRGKLELGPEIFEELNTEAFLNSVVEKSAKVIKVSEELGLVFGFAIVCKIDGVDYYD